MTSVRATQNNSSKKNTAFPIWNARGNARAQTGALFGSYIVNEDLKRETPPKNQLNCREKGLVGEGSNVVQLRQNTETTEAQLQSQMSGLRSRIRGSEETIRALRRRTRQLTEQLAQANLQIEQVQRTAKKDLPQAMRPEPTRQPSTYIVPERSRTSRFNRLTLSAPILSLLVMLGGLLALVLSLTLPPVTMLMSPAIIAFVKVLFMMVAFCGAIAFIFEIFNYQTV